MNKTKKGIGIALAVLMVAAALAAPAIADYSGDHPLTMYKRGMVDGGLIYETVTDGSGYTQLDAIDSATYSQDITIDIPEGATVKLARLYNYYTWSKSDNGDKYTPGDPAEAVLTFNGASVTCQNPDPITNHIDYGNGVVQYWDSKGQGYSSSTIYDFPSGTFAWDVTDLVTGSNTATITNADSSQTSGEYFNTFGFGLLVVYENANSKKPNTQYWITEGCDYLMAKTYETPEDATTSAWFKGGVPKFKKVQGATLTTVLTASDCGTLDPPENMVYFNSDEMEPSTAEGPRHIGVNDFDVTEGLIHKNNIAEFQDRNDCEVVCNAFLVAEYDE